MTLYAFDDFEFEAEKRLLKRNGVIHALNEKASLLLLLLLNERHNIVSKAEILDFVWSDRVVSEQVIFQNISLLRSVFGDAAIKTFSKKGYQWQLPTLELTAQTETDELQPDAAKEASTSQKPISPTENQKELTSPYKVTQRKPITLVRTLFVIVILVAISTFLGYRILHTKNAAVGGLYQFTDGQSLESLQNTSAASVQSLFDSPSSTFGALSPEGHLLIAIKAYPFAEHAVLRFHVQGKRRHWSDYLIAETQDKAFETLQSVIQQLNKQNYFDHSNPNIALAALQLIDDSSLLNREVIKLHFESADWHRASTLIDAYLSEPSSEFDYAMLLWMKSKALFENKQFADARVELDEAIKQLTPMNIPPLIAELQLELAWHHLVSSDFRAGIQSLNEAAGIARQANEPLLELNAHRIQAFIASKDSNLDMAYSQLDFAKQLITLNHMATVHWVPIWNTEAWIESDPTIRAGHLADILSMPYDPQYEPVFYSAAQQLRDFHISSGQWSDAFSTLKSWQRSSFQSLSKAHIEIAKGNLSEGVLHASTAFHDAQLSQQKQDSLDSALLLLSLPQEHLTEISRQSLVDYINVNATRRWKDQNAAKFARFVNNF
ncbi:transcriptional regulator [Alteromonas facilis]|uniref:transcriptional regulator n=1 Tax=Alteromonas facilis TaxID=2048004 RepID=UPI000C28F781|nr:winged helix-turn-helix domain-containing protein [Alteromonas facilis]